MTKRIGDFVGRSAELAVLDDEWTLTRQGESRLVLVSGGPGIGKSELIYEFASAVSARSRTSVVACRPSLSGARANAIVVDLIRQLVGLSADALDLSGIDEVGRRVLRRLAPDIFGAQESGAKSRWSSGDRAALYEAVGWLLRQATARTRVLVVIEDLHAAAQDSLKVVAALVEQRLPATLFVLTARAHEPNGDLLDELTEVALATGAFRSLELKELTVEEVVALTGSIAPTGDPARLGAALFRRTSGHPFFATSILRTIRDEGPDAPSGQLDRAHVPDEIVAHIARRANRLSPSARRAIELRAVVGDDVPVDLLAAALPMPLDEFLDALVEAAGAGLIISNSEDSRLLRFSHELVRDAIYWRLPALQKARLHRAIAEAISGAYTPDLVAMYASHCYEAAAIYPEIRSRSVDASLEAGYDCMSRIAYHDAISHYWRAFEHASTDLQRAPVEASLGEAFARCGDISEARQHLDQAALLARQVHDVSLLAKVATTLAAVGTTPEVPDPALRALYEEALAYLPADEVFWRIRLLGALSREMPPQPKPQLMPPAALQTVKRAIGDEDPATRAYGLKVRLGALLDQSDSTGRAATVERLVLEAEIAGDPHLLTTAHTSRVVIALERADPVQARESIDACKLVAERFRYPLALWTGAMLDAGCTVWQRPLTESADAVEQAHDLGQPLGHGWVELAYLIQRALIDRELGRTDDVMQLLRISVETYQWSGSLWKAALANCICGVEPTDRDEAIRLVEEIEQDGYDQVLFHGTYSLMWSYLADVYAYLGDRRGATRLLPLLEASLHVQPIAGSLAVYWGSMAYHLGLLRATVGDHEAAVAEYEAAYKVDQRMGSPLWTCHTHIAHAQTLQARGLPKDLHAAKNHEVTARRIAEQFGYLRALQELDGQRPRHIPLSL